MLQLNRRVAGERRIDHAGLRVLKTIIERKYGCLARHAGSVHVLEQREDQVLWEGMVEVFELMGHRQAFQCYTWRRHSATGQPEFVTALSPPAKSPQDAIRTYLAEAPRPAQPAAD